MTQVGTRPNEPGADQVSIVAVTAPADLHALERILGHTRWSLEKASCMADVMDRLRENPSVVVITDPNLTDGNWKDLLARTQEQPLPPPLIVAAHHADDRLWMEVLNSGGYNVIGKPFDGQEVFRVISMAWLHGRKRPKAAAHAR